MNGCTNASNGSQNRCQAFKARQEVPVEGQTETGGNALRLIQIYLAVPNGELVQFPSEVTPKMIAYIEVSDYNARRLAFQSYYFPLY